MGKENVFLVGGAPISRALMAWTLRSQGHRVLSELSDAKEVCSEATVIINSMDHDASGNFRQLIEGAPEATIITFKLGDPNKYAPLAKAISSMRR